VRHTYDEFVAKVAERRKRTVAEIDSSAHGRVWVGTDALERGLVDKLGNLPEAVASAAELAGLEESTYRIEYVEPQLSFGERLAMQLTTATLAPVLEMLGASRWQSTVSRWLETAMEPFAFLERLNDPRGVYAYCFCDIR
jgi:protease-4